MVFRKRRVAVRARSRFGRVARRRSSAPRRRPSARRTSFRRRSARRTGTSLRVLRPVSAPSALVKLKDQFQSTWSWAQNAIASCQFLQIQNSAIDPYVGAGGSTPTGLPEWAAFYGRVIVYAMKVTTTFVGSPSVPSMCIATYEQTGNTEAGQGESIPAPITNNDIMAFYELPRGRVKLINGQYPTVQPGTAGLGSNGHMATMVQYRRLKEMWPIPLTDQYFASNPANSLDDPVKTMRFFFAIQPFPAAGVMGAGFSITTFTRVKLYCKFYQPLALKNPTFDADPARYVLGGIDPTLDDDGAGVGVNDHAWVDAGHWQGTN